MKLFRRNPTDGSALLAAMTVIVILSFAAAGILSFSLTSYRNSVRQALMDQAKEIADSEMENLYYAWKADMLAKHPVANVQTDMAVLLANTVPFEANLQTAGGWSVQRQIQFDPIAGTPDGSAQGLVDATDIGRNYYFTAKTSATIQSPFFGTVYFHSGRTFVFSSTSLFQYAVFYQGNLEMAAGGNMTIGGPVSTNASAYLGAQANNGNPYTLTLTDVVHYFQDYNGAPDPLSGETDYLEGVSTLVDPVYNPNPNAAAPINQPAQRALQVQKMSSQASFVGGVDVAADIANPTYQAAYTNLQGVVDPNEIYRAVIAPPPVDVNGNLLPEDPVVASSRIYNSAGVLITINQASATSPVQIDVGTAANPQLYDTDPAFATIVHPTGAATSVLQNVRTTIVDPRELLNGSSGVNLTTLDVGNLNTALAAAMASDATLQQNYNGVVYIYDNTNNTAAGAPNTLNGIRLTDGQTTPSYNDQNGNPLGFSVVSNNGVYVQGDYNTTQITVAGSQINNPAAILGDAITALSATWNLANSSTLTPISSREAGPSSAGPYGGTNNGMLVNAAILTGNTPSTTTDNSGGAQNLVRMIEDWFYPDPLGNNTGMVLTLNGSLGQLFTSKYFQGAYAPGVQAGLLAGSPAAPTRVYIQPKTRVLNYDTGLKSRPPTGSPVTTKFSRGDFFFW